MPTAVEAIRNVAFVGHPSAGKTTLVDALAFAVGASARKGRVADKTSICDTEPEEQEKGHTLQMAVVQAEHKGKLYTFIDTPGYPDFVADANAATCAADLVVGVVSCASGVTFNLRKKLETAAKVGRGCAIVVTHVDGDNADFDEVLAQLRERIGEVCVPFLLPDKSGPGFSAVHTVFDEKAGDWKRHLMDRIMDACEDEALLERYLETEELSEQDLRANIPNAIAKGKVVPVLACNPDSGLGLEKVLSFLEHFGPSPALTQWKDTAGKPVATGDGVLLGVALNVKADPHVGKIVLFRVLRGRIGSADALIGPRSAERGEKLGGLFRLVGKKREPLESAGLGEIAGFAKVEQVSFGESFTVTAKEFPKEFPKIALIEQPRPMVALAVFPKSRADEQKISEALSKLAAEDPTFTIEYNKLTHQLVMNGMSELHLQVMESRLKRRYGVEITTQIPKVHYKETITKKAEGHHRHKKQTGGRGQFGECYIRLKPLPKNSGVTFTDSVVGGSIPRNLIPAVEKGMRDIVSKGVLTDSEVVDLDFEVYDGKFHDVDSDEASFKMAGSRAFMDGFQKAGPVLLEPVMELVISIPTESAGHIFSDLTSHRRGQVVDQWTDADGTITVVKAHVPLATVLTYQRDLKSQTSGEGNFSMSLVDYQPVPSQEQARILATHGKKHHEES